MSIISFPTDIPVERMRIEQQRMDLSHTSPMSGITQSVAYGLPRWKASVTIGRLNESSSGSIKALLMKLRGQINQLALWDIGRPAPIGTITGTLTLSNIAVLGDDTLTISGGTNGQTLKAGDWIGIGSDQTKQLVMVTDDATVSSGTVTVNIQPPLRTSHLSGASVVIDRPTALFRLTNANQGWDYESVFVTGFTLDLVEDWNA